VIVVGRSIGTGNNFFLIKNTLGPAAYISSKYHIGALILISAFTKLNDVIKDKYG